MLIRIRKLIVLFFVVAIAATVVALNLEPITVHYTPGRSFTAIGGVVLLGVFAAGIALAATFWVFFGIKTYFRERSFLSKEKSHRVFYKGFLEARSLLASNEWLKAQDKWERIVKKDPTDIIARIELSRCLEGNGEYKEALRVLEAARLASPNNVEVLLRAAELNVRLKNATGAIDNLALALYNQPSRKAARMARDLSESLGRIEDALEYHRQLSEIEGVNPASDEAGMRLQFKKLLLENAGNDDDTSALYNALKRFIKRYPEFGEAQYKMATLELRAGRLNEAASLLIKAAKASGEHNYWNEAMRLWLSQGSNEAALAAARAATRNTSGEDRITAELDLIRLYLALRMTDEAKAALDGFNALVADEDIVINSAAEQSFIALSGYCKSKLGDSDSADDLWQKLGGIKALLGESTLTETFKERTGTAPAPQLSTP
jgi:tetratricopeptide (TPR) repeat protein